MAFIVLHETNVLQFKVIDSNSTLYADIFQLVVNNSEKEKNNNETIAEKLCNFSRGIP